MSAFPYYRVNLIDGLNENEIWESWKYDSLESARKDFDAQILEGVSNNVSEIELCRVDSASTDEHGRFCEDLHTVEFYKNPDFNEKKAREELEREADEWQREMAMEAGMCFGADAYNDYMGW